MKVLFLCDSPLQALNAIEAKNHFNIADADASIMIFKGVSEKNYQQQLSVIREINWGEVTTFKSRLSPAYLFFSIKKINKLLLRKKGFDIVFIGEYRSPVMRHIVNYFKPEKVVLMDDGNATIYISADRRYHSYTYTGAFKKIKKLIGRYILGLYDDYLYSVTYFTLYNINVSLPDSVEKNNYSVLHKRLEAKDYGKDVFFLGCPFVESDSVSDDFSEDLYLNLLVKIQKKMIKEYGVDSITYVAHRRESLTKLSSIKSMPGFNVIDFNEPVELALIKLEVMPVVIATFYSAAVDLLVAMYGTDVMFLSYRLPSSCIDTRNIETVNGYYDYYKREYKKDNFKLIEM